MAGKFVRASKYRHVFGQASKKTECYDSLRITKNSLENYYIAINSKYIALCIDAGGGGAFVIIPHEKVIFRVLEFSQFSIVGTPST